MRQRRLVPQGLQAALGARARCAGSCASSRSTTARASSSTASRSAPTAAPTCRSRCACPAGCCKRSGTNRLVVRVDNRRFATDFPPSGLTTTGTADRRLVELRRHPARGLPAQRRPRRLQHRPGAPGPAVRDLRRHRRRPRRRCATTARRPARPRHVARSAPARVDLGTRTIGPEALRHAHHAAIAGRQPAALVARVAAPLRRDVHRARRRPRPAALPRETGIRSIKVVGGHLLLNGRPLNFRGFGLHEDSPDHGFAIDNADREQQIAVGAPGARRDGDARALPAASRTTRAARRARDARLVGDPGLRGQDAVPQAAPRPPAGGARARDNILDQRQPPVDHRRGRSATSSARARARSRATTSQRAAQSRQEPRPDAAGRPTPLPATRAAGCQPEYAPLDVIGINEYFGWYPGPERPDRRPHAARRTTSTACARAIPTRRS